MKFIVMILLIILSVGCHKSSQKPPALKIVQVQRKVTHQLLHFNGIIKPLHETALISTTNATIAKINHPFGQWVKKGEIIFTLNSAELQKEFNQTLTDYLKAKDNFTITKAKFNGTQDLWDAGLISKNNYLSEQSGLATAQITLIQSTKNLADLLKKTGKDSFTDFTNLSLEHFAKVRRALSSKHNFIIVPAPKDGVLLYPPKSSDQSATTLTVGSSVKSGEVLGVIGDLSGIRLEITIPEVDIASLRIGMPATIHGVAFGNQELHGNLVEISSQAQSNTNSELPTFNATVEVHNLTSIQRSFIKVGMSANLDLKITQSAQLMVPIEAISQKDEQTIVHVRTKNGKISERQVVTGMVNANQVVITSGLSVGDEIVYD